MSEYKNVKDELPVSDNWVVGWSRMGVFKLFHFPANHTPDIINQRLKRLTITHWKYIYKPEE